MDMNGVTILSPPLHLHPLLLLLMSSLLRLPVLSRNSFLLISFLRVSTPLYMQFGRGFPLLQCSAIQVA